MPYIDLEDIEQEIALAKLQGKSPKLARDNEYRRQRKHYKREKPFTTVYGETWQKSI